MTIRKSRLWLVIFASVVALCGLVAAGGAMVYQSALRPYDPNSDQAVNVEVKSGMNGAQVVSDLAKRNVIRSELAASIYLRINHLGADLKAGVYTVKQSQSTPDILRHIMGGQVDQRSITLYPGAMLVDLSNTPTEKKVDLTTVLGRAGFSQDEISRALKAQYRGAVYASKPAGADLEGLLYGETYFIPTNASAEQIIQRALDEFDKVVQDNDLEAQFAKHGLSLYEGITLASIVQREVSCHGAQLCQDQRVVAQIFFKRLKEKMPLGADATFVYAANIVGKSPTVDFDSPYNTRIHGGLTPGPISSPGLGALRAVADPADTDYLYFVSDDDFTNHFATTYQEHNDNIKKYCNRNCRLPQ